METLTARMTWASQRALSEMGALGLVAVALLVCAAALAGSALGQRREAAALAAQNAREAAQASRAAATAVPQSTPSSDLERFNQLLPHTADIAAVIATLHAAALESGIDLPEGQFKLVTEDGNPIARYQMAFPVKAEYAHVRKFVRAALQALPTVGLDELSFRRDDATSPLLETRVQFTLYLHAGA